ncbi:MAG: N-acetylmuramoyl-L-alanine amidase [Anaerolineales bacterium]|nr:N-acetylmuramoyl-L-alanine amidase [Anaerolineales bacterium]
MTMKISRKAAASRHSRTRFYYWTVGLGAALATAFITFAPSALSPDAIRSSFAGVINPTPGGLGPISPFKLPIGIVAGHSGNDSGATCDDGLTEVSINEDIAVRVKALLERQGYVVDLLEEYDSRLEGYKAMALVSLHADSCQFIDDNATGFKVAASQAGSSAEASRTLAACLVSRYAARTGLKNHPGSVTWDMTGYHSFTEVHPETPAAIIEMGFLYLDRYFLTQHADIAAQGIAEGILCFTRGESPDASGTSAP